MTDLAGALAAFLAENSTAPQKPASGPRVVYSGPDPEHGETSGSDEPSARIAPRGPRVIYCGPDHRDRMRGRPKGDKPPLTQAERNAKRTRSIEAKQRRNNIMVIDTETDPFDNTKPNKKIWPFLAVLHSERFAELCPAMCDPAYPDCVIIWEANHDRLVRKVCDFLDGLPEAFTAYAHNGGRFDFMFWISRMRGEICTKGGSLMSARYGKHALRDSLHIIPESQQNIEKDDFDYNLMQRRKRAKHRDAIIRYCVSDCRKLLHIVKKFIDNFGLKLTVGQAAISELKKEYPDIKRLGEGMDGIIREYYHGGRVECIAGRGDFHGDYKTYDINSSYPNVMAKFKHPIGDFFDYKIKKGGPITDQTCFIELECDNRGALIALDDEGRKSATHGHGIFKTTIHEFNTAIKYDLISNIKIITCLDCSLQTTFEKFVLPRYEKRQAIKAELAAMKARGGENSRAWFDLRDADLFEKIIMNSSYGKTGQNPRRHVVRYLTDPGQEPPEAWFNSLSSLPEHERGLYRDGPEDECVDYWIWHKPTPRLTFNNVGVAASVTGAARAVLLEALQHAEKAIYCDTDSIICENLEGVDLHPTRLGAWDCEDEATRVAIAGRKLYCVWHARPKKRTKRQLVDGLSPDYTIKNKGVSVGELTCDDLLGMLDGGETVTRNRAPTLNRLGGQSYIERRIRATAKAIERPCPDLFSEYR
jgi:Vibrio phage DNA polymerase